MRQAAAINPDNPSFQNALAKALIENGEYDAAYRQYTKILARFPNSVDALVNHGLLAVRLGHAEVAMGDWERAAFVAPSEPNPHLYLAEAFDQNHQQAAAVPHWKAFLRFASAHPDDPAAGVGQQISATIRLADDESMLNDSAAASSDYSSAISLAQKSGDWKLASVAVAHLADEQEKAGDAKSAAESYRRALKFDADAQDPRSEASDWFNYGQFLRRQGIPDDLAYACFLRAENLLSSAGGPDLETVKGVRRKLEKQLGKQAAVSQKNLSALLARAADLPSSSF